jgi:hypothetical protein
MPREQVYNQTMYILAGMLLIGLISNLLIRPLHAKHFMTEAELAEERRRAHERAAATEAGAGSQTHHATHTVWVVLAWTAVGLPLAWGVYRTILSVLKFIN